MSKTPKMKTTTTMKMHLLHLRPCCQNPLQLKSPNSTSVGRSRSWIRFCLEEEGSNPHLASNRRNDLTQLKFSGCPVGVMRMSGGCLEGVWMVSGWCLDGVWRVSMKCPNGLWGCLDVFKGQVRTYQVRTDKVKTGQIRTGQVRRMSSLKCDMFQPSKMFIARKTMHKSQQYQNSRHLLLLVVTKQK